MTIRGVFAFEIVQTPTNKNSLAPNLCSFGNHFVLSWIERNTDGEARLQMATWNGSEFDEIRLIAKSKGMFANWADIPSLVEAPSGDLYAHWLNRISNETYAYGIQIERSIDHGKSWQSLGWLHNDTSATEHGFVSLIPENRHVRAFWLDGRQMKKPTGKMMLRTAILDANEIKSENMLDDDVCTCCPTGAIQLPSGSAVVYRDRLPQEIRDISLVHLKNNAWSKPSRIEKDNWVMPGCPVNGPSIATNGNIIAVSRFTVIKNKAKIILRLFKDGQTASGKEITLDEDIPVGRCTTVCSKDAVYNIWIGVDKKQTVLRMAEVSLSGKIKRKITLVPIDKDRSSGMPRAIFSNNYLWVSWTGSNQVRLGRLKANIETGD
ncbi:MAG: hypothetical protein CMO45_02195 [Verrucomicrobiales bacterium]|nr:hypothetical protein [Verrucomicrobiales bacterium]